MKLAFLISSLLLFCKLNTASSQTMQKVSLDEIIDSFSLHSPSAKIEKLNFQNKLLLFENYKKKILPALSLNLNPININRSLRLLQLSTDGSYSYIEDYSNSSSFGISLKQKIGITGGELNVESNLNYLKEFSNKRKSYSTTPFNIKYSQQFFGSSKLYRLEKIIEYTKNSISIKQYCINISQIQQESLNLFMAALLNKMESELTLQTKKYNDTLLNISKIKLSNGCITPYDFKRVELQSLNIQYAYENSRKNYIESCQRLFTFLGIERTFDITVPDFNLPINIDTHLVEFYIEKNNPFSKQQEIQKLEAKKELFSIKLNNRFNGNISVNYGINQYAETFTEAYRHPNTMQSLIIGFQIPVFQWGINRNKIRLAKNAYKAKYLAIDKKIHEFKNEICERINTYNHSIRIWFTAEKAYNLSKEQFQMSIQKFALGKISVYELTSTLKEQNDNMQRYYTAIKDSYNSYFSLRSMTLYDFKQEKELEELFLSKKI